MVLQKEHFIIFLVRPAAMGVLNLTLNKQNMSNGLLKGVLEERDGEPIKHN